VKEKESRLVGGGGMQLLATATNSSFRVGPGPNSLGFGFLPSSTLIFLNRVLLYGLLTHTCWSSDYGQAETPPRNNAPA
jgi:hypothetical protein